MTATTAGRLNQEIVLVRARLNLSQIRSIIDLLVPKNAVLISRGLSTVHSLRLNTSPRQAIAPSLPSAGQDTRVPSLPKTLNDVRSGGLRSRKPSQSAPRVSRAFRRACAAPRLPIIECGLGRVQGTVSEADRGNFICLPTLNTVLPRKWQPPHGAIVCNKKNNCLAKRVVQNSGLHRGGCHLQ